MPLLLHLDQCGDMLGQFFPSFEVVWRNRQAANVKASAESSNLWLQQRTTAVHARQKDKQWS